MKRPIQTEKRCSRCGITKSFTEFSPCRQRLASWCKACCNEVNTAIYHQEDPVARRKRRAAYNVDPWSLRARRLNRSIHRRGHAGLVSREELRRAWEAYDCRCWICGEAATETDHFRPLNKNGGGKHEASNVRPICTECNHKRDRVWRGIEKANKEAALLCQLKQMLHE